MEERKSPHHDKSIRVRLQYSEQLEKHIPLNLSPVIIITQYTHTLHENAHGDIQ